MQRVELAIIGGGIAGLSAGWYAQKKGMNYTVLEASSRWGGKIRTEKVDMEYGNVIIEHGPDSFITQKPWALQLARELGLEDRLLGTNEVQKRTFVLNRGKLVDLPEGVMLIVPTQFLPFVRSPLISPIGKLRMGLEALMPARTDDEDESLADFVKRRLGNEALDKLAEPLMSGIYNTDAEEQSLLATFPRFRDLEKKYGSITRGMLESRRKIPATTGKPKSIFMSLKGGMSELVETLVSRLSADLRLNTAVTHMTAFERGYKIEVSAGEEIIADKVLIALPAYQTASLLRSIAPELSAELESIRYIGTGTINLLYRKSDIPRPIKGYGLVIPRSEKRRINAITVSSTKFDHRAPDELTLMRIFFGGARTPETFLLDDAELESVVRRELEDLTGITADPLVARIVRNKQATPQYDVGHLRKVDRIEKQLPPNIYVTGSAFRGVGVPDCIHQSQQIIEEIEHSASVVPVPAM